MLILLCILCCVCYVSIESVILPEFTSPAISGVIQNGSSADRSVRATTCILPPYPDHGTYDVMNGNNDQPGQSFDSFVLSVSCHRGYGIQDPNVPYGSDALVYCIQGLWPQPMPECVRFCKLDPHPSVDYLCHVPTVGYKSCEGYLAPGTSVNPVCKSPNYFSAEIFIDMECISGRWNYIAKCKAECGRVLPKGGMGLIISGTYSKRGEVPWHVGIYRKTSTPYEQICGGSIITNNVVISAAHCFANRNPSKYGVATGKIYRPWDDKEDVTAQKSDVKDIKIPELYQGAVSHFGVDIAGLILVTPFIYDSFVRPVCLNFDGTFDRYQLQDGKLGKVAGWGLTTANGNSSPSLLVVDLPFINSKTCIDTLPMHFRPYITVDKFCAGYTNGTALCRGDSGGGLAFFDQELGINRYYLRGIVSTAARSEDNNVCNDHTYTAFTRIATHQDFIKSVIALSERNTCEDADCNGILENVGDNNMFRPVSHTNRILPKPYEESCEWEGIKGKCVPAKVCLTTLDEDGEKPPVCPDKNGKLNYVCCTDCQLVNDTSDFVISAEAETFWKDGRKSRDACLQYMKEVPHACYQEGNSAGLSRRLDKEKKCHTYNIWRIPGRGVPKISGNPTEALLGNGDSKTDAWYHTGTIITDKFILTSAFIANLPSNLKQAAVPKTRNGNIKSWQIHTVDKIYTHPEYKKNKNGKTGESDNAIYNDIALLELGTRITFSNLVFPACLPDPSEEFNITTANNFHWSEQKVFELAKITTEECNAELTESQKRLLPELIRSESQMCYKTKDNCVYNWGPPITVTTQYSRCMNTVIGVGGIRVTCEIAMFTNVKYYTPWIESIVWPTTSMP